MSQTVERQTVERQTVERQTVVLIHGLGGSRLDMWRFGRRLHRAGFQTHKIGYFSLGQRIEPLVDRVKELLGELQDAPSVDGIHLVGHSMGAIIARAALADQRPIKVKSLLMVAPPNQGSHVARCMAPWFSWIVPSLAQLSDAPDSYVNQLDELGKMEDLKLGIIEAEKDRVIAPGAVRLNRPHEYCQVRGHHGILTWYRRTGQLAEMFLRKGRFA